MWWGGWEFLHLYITDIFNLLWPAYYSGWVTDELHDMHVDSLDIIPIVLSYIHFSGQLWLTYVQLASSLVFHSHNEFMM